MSGDAKQNSSTVLLVIGLCAALGFGAVYAIVGGGDNSSHAAQPEKAVATARPVAAVMAKGVVEPTAAARTGLAGKTGGGAAAITVAQLLDAEGKPLNRGAVTTFVFKKEPAAPDKNPTFNGPDGKPMTLADLKGRVVLLNLWATWCAPCRKEMPYLDTLQKELGGDQFEVVALSVDRGAPDKARKFLSEIGVSSLRFYHDPTAQAGFALMAIGMPTTLLIDRSGRELGRLVGPAEWHSKEAKDLIRAAIAAD